MQTQGFLLVAAAIPNIVIGCFILLRNIKDKINISFALFALAVSCWSLGLSAYIFTNDLERAFMWAQFYYLAAAVIAVSFAYFSLYYTRKSQAFNWWNFLGVLPFIVLASLIIFYPGFLMEGVEYRSWGKEVVLNKVGYLAYAIYFTAYVGYGFATILSSLLRARGVQRINLKFVFGGLLIAFSMGATFNLVLPYLGNYQYIWVGPLFTIAYVGLISYAIVKHGLFDIGLAVVRSMAYVLSLLTLAVIYYAAAYLISMTVFKGEVSESFSVGPMNIILALLLAFIFQPVKSFFDKTTNSIFYRDQYDPEEFFARFSATLTSTTDLRTLLERASREISTTLKAEQAFFYVNDFAREHHVSAGTERHQHFTHEDVSYLDTYAKKHNANILVSHAVEDEAMLRFLNRRKIGMILPLWRANDIVGYLVLGDRLSGAYSKRDIRSLLTISDELVIAIQNTLSVQQVKEANTLLEERIAQATKELRASNSQLRQLDTTKDEFISMASHQLRTPLTSVKGYISMVLDGDVGKITDQQRILLQQAFESSQRMVFLISDFLNVSRIQTGKFMLEPTTFDITMLVKEEVNQLQETARARDMEIIYNPPDNIPPITADQMKLRQVMMNFIDNAIFYSLGGSKITVQLYKDSSSVVYKVIDTGIGVPKAEQAKLFTKFFRADNARKQRPDGTGVGIYMAKKVVVSHGGSIIFESTEGKGSTFGFRLPLKDDLKKLNK